jgi:hypothetical protein
VTSPRWWTQRWARCRRSCGAPVPAGAPAGTTRSSSARACSRSPPAWRPRTWCGRARRGTPGLPRGSQLLSCFLSPLPGTGPAGLRHPGGGAPGERRRRARSAPRVLPDQGAQQPHAWLPSEPLPRRAVKSPLAHAASQAPGDAPADSEQAASGLRFVSCADAASEPGSDLELTLRLAERSHLPSSARFALLCRVRAARAAATPQSRLAFAQRRLVAVFALMHALATDHGASTTLHPPCRLAHSPNPAPCRPVARLRRRRLVSGV